MNARQYYQGVLQAVDDAPMVLSTNFSFDEIDVDVCYIRGTLMLPNDCELHIAEYVITSPSIERPKYRYHLQKKDGSLLARWDNAPHHPQLATFPDHRHDATGAAYESTPVDIAGVLDLLAPLIFSAG